MLTNLLLLIVVTGGFLYGLRLIRALDRFLAENGRETRQRETEQEYAVIFGIRQEAELEKWFEAAGIQTVFITDVHMEKEWKKVRYLVALGESDVDNLSICNLFRKTCPKTEIYSICNEKALKKLYRQAGASVFYNREELLQRMELITLEHEVGAA